ncbi:MAG: hypothetical protein WCD47_07720 [Candidatus Sulfotelmatobacter sp.]
MTRFNSLKIASRNADNGIHMVNSISSANASSTNEVTQQAARQPQPPAQAPTNGPIPQDTVSLKSTGDLSAGDPDHDGK